MLGVKLFILLYLVYIANAQYRRTPLRQLPARSKPAESPSYDAIEGQAIPPSLANPTRTRSIPPVVEPEIKTITISKRPNVDPNEEPPRKHPNRALFKPNRQIPPRRVSWNFKHRIQPIETYVITTESEPEPESTIKSVSELETINRSTIKPPSSSSETHLDDETKLELGPEVSGSDSERAPQPKSRELDSQSDPEPTESEVDYKSELKPNFELIPDLEPKSESKHEPEAELEPKLEPEDELEPKLEPKSEPVAEFKPKLEPKPEVEVESRLKPESDPTPLPKNPETPEENPEVPGLRTRSPFTMPVTGSEPDPTTKPKPEIDGKLESNPQNQSSDLDFQCKENNKYYAIPHSCDRFFECQKFVAKKRTCPDGLLFDPKAKFPRYPCSYPSEVECGNNTNTDTRIIAPTGECPRRFGSFATSANDCEKYIVCENGRPSIMNCPMGLGFNSKISACDWPANIPSCNPKVFKDFICPVPPRGNKADKVYNYRYKNSCKLYITCIQGEPRLLRCDSGLSFDDRSSRCISSAAVSNCRTVSEIVDTKLFISKA